MAGVVGWIDMAAPDAPERLAGLAGDPRLVGVRPMLQDIADADWMLRPVLEPAVRALVEHDLRFDALVSRSPARLLASSTATPPAGRDRPRRQAGHRARARAQRRLGGDIAGLARDTARPLQAVRAGHRGGARLEPDDLRPYVDHLLDCFGPERLMWGSDWPVVELAGGYEKWWHATESLLAGLDDDERGAILGGTAAASTGGAPPAP